MIAKEKALFGEKGVTPGRVLSAQEVREEAGVEFRMAVVKGCSVLRSFHPGKIRAW